jgi:hypothetical protein
MDERRTTKSLLRVGAVLMATWTQDELSLSLHAGSLVGVVIA